MVFQRNHTIIHWLCHTKLILCFTDYLTSGVAQQAGKKQVDILISKNQALLILYVYIKQQIFMDKKPTKSTKI